MKNEKGNKRSRDLEISKIGLTLKGKEEKSSAVKWLLLWVHEQSGVSVRKQGSQGRKCIGCLKISQKFVWLEQWGRQRCRQEITVDRQSGVRSSKTFWAMAKSLDFLWSVTASKDIEEWVNELIIAFKSCMFCFVLF